MQSHFERTLSAPVMLIGFLLLHVPGVFGKNPSKPPKSPESDLVKPSFVERRVFSVNLIIVFIVG